MDHHEETESVLKHFPALGSSGPDGSTGKFYQTFRGTNTSPSQLVPNKEEGTFPKSSYETGITLIPKPDKNTRKEHYRLISLMNIDVKILKKLLAN